NSEWKEKEFFNKENYFKTSQKDFEKIPGRPIAYWVSEKVRDIFATSQNLELYGKARRGLQTGDSEKFIRNWAEVSVKKINKKWYKFNNGGFYRKWYGCLTDVVNWKNNGESIKLTGKAIVPSEQLYLKEVISWNKISSGKFTIRFQPLNFIPGDASPFFYTEKHKNYFLSLLNSKVAENLLSILSPTLNYQVGDLSKLPIILNLKNLIVEEITKNNIEISKNEWDSRETSWDFEGLELVQGDSLESSYEKYCESWREKFFTMHKNEEELNRMFIEIYGLEDEMDEKVELGDITLLKKETSIVDGELTFNKEELTKQFLSYAVGCVMGRYSIDKPGLIMANSDDVMVVGEGKIVIEGADGEIRHEITNPTFIPDAHGIVPILREDIFENDIVSRVIEFLKAVYGDDSLEENLNFIAEGLGKKSNEDSKDVIRKYFIKDFYKDHLQRYKKRPIYWMINSGKKDAFSALVYLHRYEDNTIGRVRADYLLHYQEVLDNTRGYFDRLIADDNTHQKDKKDAEKRLKELDAELKELKDFSNEVKHIGDLKISLDLDDGVKVNYDKFGKILKKI
ncbi:BREX-1 system adenine-specific DNA-methyltransferase PglX, partial [Cetobacterium sp.]|uniref:BREX-1 system adenine-specific DNA-methyltransferase PglX n=1 Tax=Cetobacterium sp. TaxID=2071632 RepID=UPI003F2ECB69